MPPSKPRSSSSKSKAALKTSPQPKPDAEAGRAAGTEASRRIDQRIRELGDWRGKTLSRMRALILEADPEMLEEWKWMGTPVWSHGGKNICTGETYKQVVKLTFARGASLPDPRGLFNSSLAGNTRRAIDIRQGETIDAEAFKRLIQAAVAEIPEKGAGKKSAKNVAKPAARAKDAPAVVDSAKTKSKSATKGDPAASPARSTKRRKEEKVVLLSGGNPQIAKAEGDAPVRAYIAAMPGWKQDFGTRLDALIVKHVPKLRKAVKWNSPFYGVEGQGWFLSFHVFTRYVKVTFFQGTSLKPVPPGGTGKDARWIDIHEGEPWDEKQMAAWIKQAAKLPGWLA